MNNEETRPDRMLELLAWVEVNKKQLLYGLVGALLLGLGFYIFNYSRHQRELSANAALFALDKLPEGRERAAHAAAADYFTVAKDFSGTRAAERALLLGAGVLFAEKEFGKAQEKFEQFLSEYPASPSASTAAYGVAACHDAKNDVDKAMEGYQRVITSYSTAPEVTQAKLALALLHEVKTQPDSALKVYDDLLRKPSVWNSEANMRREMLLAKYPHLAVPAAPPVFKAPTAFAPPTNAPAGTNVTLILTNAGAAKASNAVTSAPPKK